MPTNPFNDQYFATNTYKNVSFAKYSQYWWSNRFYGILARRFSSSGGRILEEGCGLGHLIGQLEIDFDTFGMDINLWALKEATKNAGASRLVCSSAEGLPYPNNSFNAIISKHVVEHLAKPSEAIKEIGRILAPGGMAIISTPNLDSLLKPLKKERWIGYQDPTHISLHTPEEWKVMINDSSLQIVRTFSDGFWDVPYFSGLPIGLQKLLFGSLGGFQAITGFVFLPPRWGESIIFIARKV
jgi:SAM-dependent methyltransferase